MYINIEMRVYTYDLIKHIFIKRILKIFAFYVPVFACIYAYWHIEWQDESGTLEFDEFLQMMTELAPA